MAHAYYQAVVDSDGNPLWRRDDALGCFLDYQGECVLCLPEGARATCNGVEVVGAVQALGTGDLVRIRLRGESEIHACIGAAVPDLEPGDRRPDDFTGAPIEGDGVRCAKCRALFAADNVARLKFKCPQCQSTLGDCGNILPPPEELL
jgi:hypothetical protein